MVCHICGQQAIGLCQACWKAYCRQHGERLCGECRQRPAQGRGSVASVVLGHEAGEHRTVPSRTQEPFTSKTDELVSVIGVAQRVQAGETNITLLSLERYVSGFILNFRLGAKNGSPPVPGPGFFPKFPQFDVVVTDNRGNSYQGHAGSGGGSVGEWRSERRYSPAPASAATSLKVTISEIRWMSGPGGAPSPEKGPWEFSVTL